jgi:2-polyprenyl-3-methyl-5-hydroxy-6-metoxy-1,4-benzoquinol methylase
MSRPLRLLNNPKAAAAIVARFSKSKRHSETSYATVRDYCESLDQLPHLVALDGDLKDVQRPWAVKAILGAVPPPARLLEIGGGEPIVSGSLAEFGYDVTLVDPYDGLFNGPTDYELYVRAFPRVKIVREYFRPGMTSLAAGSFDAIFSVSVLEHIASTLPACFEATAEFLSPRGASIHCFDFILQGCGEADHVPVAQKILTEQQKLTGQSSAEPLEKLLEHLRTDVETFFLSPQGHHNWRGGRPYAEFPFRKVVSLQTIAFRSPAAAGA